MSYPVFTNIINAINGYIAAMTTVGGYNFDYGTVNEYDPASRTYPTTWTDYNVEAGIPNSDGVINRTSAYNEVSFRVRIGTSTNVDQDLQKVAADFDEMLANNFEALRCLGLLEYEYIRYTIEYRLTVNRPADIVLVYRLMYRWQKTNPSLT